MPLTPRTDVTPAEIDAVMNQSARARTLRRLLDGADDLLGPVVDLYRPFIRGAHNLPRDGRVLLVGNHTQFAWAEILLIPHVVRRELGVRVRTLAERGIGQIRGFGQDLVAAYGGVVGHPETARELMEHNETVLVFPGGGRELPKFKGEEYQLKWEGRSGFARVAIAHGYRIVPVAQVGGDDIFVSLTARGGVWERIGNMIGEKVSGRTDMTMPLVRGIGPTLIPRPQRMYLSFGTPIATTRPPRTPATTWEREVKQRTQRGLETELAELLQIRADDPYSGLNPLAWGRAARPNPGQ
jgi:1-acyl-sn-glycerol-3-phosphate acyltransferase